MARLRLAPGMTVQSAGNLWRVAYCVRCSWQSSPSSYKMAKEIACSKDSHSCKGKS